MRHSVAWWLWIGWWLLPTLWLLAVSVAMILWPFVGWRAFALVLTVVWIARVARRPRCCCNQRVIWG